MLNKRFCRVKIALLQSQSSAFEEGNKRSLYGTETTIHPAKQKIGNLLSWSHFFMVSLLY
jgi:hypothetical protein